MTSLSRAIASVLDAGAFCHLAARTERGPHLTPTVYAFSNGNLWVTTSRGSVKARAWRSDPTVSGLVRDGEDAVSFSGRVRTYDVLDADTWPNVLGRSPAVALASLRFTHKNARFFAGYAVDARHIPLAWTPPGRVFAEIEIASAALIRGDAVVEGSGVPDGETDRAGVLASRAAYRRAAAADAFVALPGRIRDALGEDGVGAICLEGRRGPAILPARWRADDDALVAIVPTEALAPADAGASCPVALAIDRQSWWRARRMLGSMVQGAADVFVPSEVRTGRSALASAIGRAGGDVERMSLVRLRPKRVVWWEGWTSGSSAVA
ncbi:MAG: pyridoxamine 5'-phosphate oxidase family protein [Actinomycetota bacterium]